MRLFTLVVCLTLSLAACRRSIENQEQVRNDLMEYLSSKVGLDMKTLDVDITKVNFVNHEAHATVSFHQKDDPSVNRGMVMMYTLTPKDGHWVVKSRADSQGGDLATRPPIRICRRVTLRCRICRLVILPSIACNRDRRQ